MITKCTENIYSEKKKWKAEILFKSERSCCEKNQKFKLFFIAQCLFFPMFSKT